MMRYRTSLLVMMAVAFTLFACNNNKYNFTGQWKYCSATDNKVWCTIAEEDNNFIIKGSTKNMVLHKKSDVLLADDSTGVTVRYEPTTNHIFISRDTSKGFELCRLK